MSRAPEPALLLALCLAAAGPGCGETQSPRTLSYGDSARRAYEGAFEAYEDDDCLTAEPIFQRVRREYPFSRYAALAELRLADCQLSQNHHIEAIRRYRSFVRHRPSHSEVPYANFKAAEAYFLQIPSDFFLSAPVHQRDQTPTRSALRQLRRFVLDYPDSEHVEAAQRMIRRSLQILAMHELYAAQFYLGEDHPRAAVGRLRRLLTVYHGSGLEAQALLLLGQTYLHARELAQARRAFRELVERYPRSGWATQARSYLGRFGGPTPPHEHHDDAGEDGDDGGDEGEGDGEATHEHHPA